MNKIQKAASEIVWCDPPKRQRPAKWQLVTDALKERAGEWARVLEDAPRGTASSARKALRSLGCQTTERTMPDDLRHLWARWPEEET